MSPPFHPSIPDRSILAHGPVDSDGSRQRSDGSAVHRFREIRDESEARKAAAHN